MNDRKIHATLAIFLFIFIATAAVLVFAPHAALQAAQEMRPTDYPHVPGELLVKLRPDAGLSVLQDLPVKNVSAIQPSGKEKPRWFKVALEPGASLESSMTLLRNRPDLAEVQPNYIYQVAELPDDPNFPGLQWNLRNTGQQGGTPSADIGMEAAWDLATGSDDVVVAVLDTGCETSHPDLSPNIWTNPLEIPGNGIDDDANGYIDDVNGWNSNTMSSDVQDVNGHGTHVAGIIGAVGNNGAGIAGINWKVRIVPVKASLDDGQGSFTSDSLRRGIDYIRALKAAGVDITAVNASLGGSAGLLDQAFREALLSLEEDGILFVAAAGNLGRNNDVIGFYPASFFYPHILSVAATDRNDALSSFSNYGRRTVHLAAPGSEICSTVPGSSYGLLSGTSMAAPHVTGVIALLKSREPDWDWIALKNKVLSGGTPLSSLSSRTITGKRLLAAGEGGLGTLNGNGQVVKVRLLPIPDTLDLEPGTTLEVAALNISDELSLGDLSIPVSLNGSPSGTLLLKDDGTSPDLAPGDGIATAAWTVPGAADSTYVFSFPASGDNLTVTVQLDPTPPDPTPSGGGGGGCSAATGPVLGLLFLVPLAFVTFRKKR